MSAAEMMTLFILVHLLLVVAYALYRMSYSFCGSVGLRISHRSWVNIAQALALTTILITPTLRLMPKNQLPEMDWSEFRAPTEVETNQQNPRKRSFSAKPAVNFERSLLSVRRSWTDLFAIWIKSDAWSFWSLILTSFLVFGWAAGLVLFIRRYRDLKRILQNAFTIRSYRSIRVVVSDQIDVPFSALVGRTRWIALSTAIMSRPSDLRLAIRHELQHHRQRDTDWAMMASLLRAFLFINPAFLSWMRMIQEFQELSCDAALLGRTRVSPRDYGSCLLQVAETALGRREMRIGTMSMVADSRNLKQSKSFLRKRIEMFQKIGNFQAHRWAGIGIGTLVCSAVVTFAFSVERTVQAASSDKVNSGTVVVNPEIQAIAEKALADAIRGEKAKAGFAIVADPQTGKILAIANQDPKRSGYWSLSLEIEPASFMKTLVAAHAIETGVTTPEEKHLCENGKYVYRGKTFHDWKEGGWETLNTRDAIAWSSDICSMKIGEKVGDEGLEKMLKQFGFGPEGTAREFPLAKTGTLPILRGRPAGVVPAITAGYSFLTTPLELIQSYGMIANGGLLLKPKLVTESDQPVVIRRTLSEDTSNQMKDILKQVMEQGTAKGRGSNRYSMVGKTATSYIPDLTKWDLMEGRKKGNFAGFIGFAPVKHPRVEIYVGIHDPQDKTGAHGSSHAAPVFKRIAEEVLDHWSVTPDL